MKRLTLAFVIIAALISVAVLMLTARGGHSAKLRKQITGTWAKKGFEMTLAPDSSFVSVVTQSTNELEYQGTWAFEDGTLRMVLTNCIARGITNFEAVGSVDYLRVIQAGDTNLAYVVESGPVRSAGRVLLDKVAEAAGVRASAQKPQTISLNRKQ